MNNNQSPLDLAIRRVRVIFARLLQCMVWAGGDEAWGVGERSKVQTERAHPYFFLFRSLSLCIPPFLFHPLSFFFWNLPMEEEQGRR
jgi:hypothetical protein